MVSGPRNDAAIEATDMFDLLENGSISITRNKHGLLPEWDDNFFLRVDALWEST